MNAFRISFSLLLLSAAVNVVVAQEKPTTEVSPDDITQWVKNLDADEYGTRQSAQKKLEKAGVAAIDAVREAAVGESQEAASRAIDILQKHARSDDESLKTAATGALQKLAEGDNAIVAERAENALKPMEEETPQQSPDTPVPVRPRVIPFGGGGGIRIEAHAIQIGGGAKRVSIKNVDGNKEIDVEEKDRKIKITESAEGHIKMKIEGAKDDMDGTKEVEAESAEELKKKDPEAYKIYEQYSKGSGGAKIEFRALPAGPLPVRPRIRVAPKAPREAIPEKQREEVEQRLKEALERLEEAQKGLEIEIPEIEADAAKARLKALETIRKQLQKQLEDVEKQIEAAKEE